MTEEFARPGYVRCKTALLLVLLASAVFLLTATEAFPGQAILSWTPPTTNIDGTPLTDLSGFKVYYGTAPRSYSQILNVGNIVTTTVSNLTEGVTYYFAVTAYDTSGNESVYSNEVQKAIPILPVLTINKNGSGTVTGPGISCGQICAAEYNPGTAIALNATPDASWVFAGWVGGGCSGSGTCVTAINTQTSITAIFDQLPPVAAFSGSPVSGSAPLFVGFADSSTNLPASWMWTFGDGYTSSLQDPGHVYQTPGLYSVSLTVANASGSNSTTRTNYITVSSCPLPRVRIARATPVYFSTLQAACDAAINGDIIQVQAFDFIENLNLNRNISLNIVGGYDCLYDANPAVTTIKGSITVSEALSILRIAMQLQ